MKKFTFQVIFLAYVLILSGIWIYQTGAVDENTTSKISEVILVVMIASFLILAIYLIVKRNMLKKSGSSTDDELTFKITQKAAASAYYVSLVVWLVLIYWQSHILASSNVMIGYGVIAMALSYVFFWLYYNAKGIGYEE
ncbi:MAG: hypothetical protein ABFS32_06335 [Bacteroidota bacterium]